MMCISLPAVLKWSFRLHFLFIFHIIAVLHYIHVRATLRCVFLKEQTPPRVLIYTDRLNRSFPRVQLVVQLECTVCTIFTYEIGLTEYQRADSSQGILLFLIFKSSCALTLLNVKNNFKRIFISLFKSYKKTQTKHYLIP